MNAIETVKHERKDYKENVQHTENFQGWTIEIESGVEIQPAWFDPDYDDHLELSEMDLEKGFNFYITKNGVTYKSLWCFRNSTTALESAKDTIMAKWRTQQYKKRGITQYQHTKRGIIKKNG